VPLLIRLGRIRLPVLTALLTLAAVALLVLPGLAALGAVLAPAVGRFMRMLRIMCGVFLICHFDFSSDPAGYLSATRPDVHGKPAFPSGLPGLIS
jgi:hypothetical protein